MHHFKDGFAQIDFKQYQHFHKSKVQVQPHLVRKERGHFEGKREISGKNAQKRKEISQLMSKKREKQMGLFQSAQ